jgi:hypothetical protein
MLEEQLLTIVVNYGLAGVVVYIFYKLISNELHDLREEIRKLSEEIKALRDAISRWSK